MNVFLSEILHSFGWKIGNIWRVKHSTEMWSLVALNVLYFLSFFFFDYLEFSQF